MELKIQNGAYVSSGLHFGHVKKKGHLRHVSDRYWPKMVYYKNIYIHTYLLFILYEERNFSKRKSAQKIGILYR